MDSKNLYGICSEVKFNIYIVFNFHPCMFFILFYFLAIMFGKIFIKHFNMSDY